jgi:sec-independent protein translocase protein TatC
MPSSSTKDPFEQTSMTFGQHLQELRVCLFKAVIGLLVGVVVGLLIGGDVVRMMKTPLSNALETYVQKQSEKRAAEQIEQIHNQGMTDVERVKELITKEQLIPQETYVDPRDVVEQLKQLFPEQAKGFDQAITSIKPAEGRNGLLRFFTFHPLKDDKSTHVRALSAQEAFTIYIKASMLVGVVLASPWIFYQIWIFVAAGLYPHERWYIHVFLPFSIGLFLAGASLAFCFVFQPVLRFLFYFNSIMGIDPDPRISEWLGFVLMLPLGFGVAFQLPLVMLFLERIGIFSTKTYWASWRIAVLAIAVTAMLLTPEPSSMMLMVVPLTFLYFGGIMLCNLMPRRKKAYTFGE